MSSILLTITDECNLRCPHCYKTNFSQSLLDIPKAVDYMASHTNITTATLYGGEPLLPKYNRDVLGLINSLPKNITELTCTSNLYFKTLTDSQLEIISHLTGLSTSWTPNRFKDLDINLWKSNIQTIYNKFHLKCSLIITLTKDLITLSPESVLAIFSTFPNCIETYKFEPFIGELNDKNRPSNKSVDIWLSSFFDLVSSIPEKFKVYDLFNYLIEGLANNTRYSINNRGCIDGIITMDVTGAIFSCPNSIYLKKNLLASKYVYDDQCLLCKYFSICGGSCQLLFRDSSGCQGYPDLYNKIKEYYNDCYRSNSPTIK